MMGHPLLVHMFKKHGWGTYENTFGIFEPPQGIIMGDVAGIFWWLPARVCWPLSQLAFNAGGLS